VTLVINENVDRPGCFAHVRYYAARLKRSNQSLGSSKRFKTKNVEQANFWGSLLASYNSYGVLADNAACDKGF